MTATIVAHNGDSTELLVDAWDELFEGQDNYLVLYHQGVKVAVVEPEEVDSMTIQLAPTARLENVLTGAR